MSFVSSACTGETSTRLRHRVVAQFIGGGIGRDLLPTLPLGETETNPRNFEGLGRFMSMVMFRMAEVCICVLRLEQIYVN